MGHGIGDAVRLREGSELRQMVEPWEDATGKVVAVFDDMKPVRINVLYGEGGPLLSTVIASEFVSDRAMSAAPF